MDEAPAPFASVRDYWAFRRHVTRERRYFHGPDAGKFLEGVKATVTDRVLELPKGRTLWRARIGHVMRPDEQAGEEMPTALAAKEMKPLPDRASEGRVNPKGMPCLYMASNPLTALSEVRPWLGAMVTVSSLVTTRALRIVDCSRAHSRTRVYLEEPAAAERVRAVWEDIDLAFSEPVSREDVSADYVPTQILAELFRDLGYDGLVFRSAFGKGGFNVALFDLAAAEVHSCGLQEVTKLSYEAAEREQPWVLTDSGFMRNVITSVLPLTDEERAKLQPSKPRKPPGRRS